MLKFTVHYGLHFLLPLLISFLFFKKNWKTVYLVFLCSMLVDLDHLFANPIFEKNRCSINFHPLHSYIAISIYSAGLFFKKTRILAFALLFHMLTDFIDCYL
jgi:phosphatidylglycerophosphate synthase